MKLWKGKERMPNKFTNDEKGQKQRKRWNEYNSRYAKANYRTFTIKLNKKTYAKEIAYLEQSPNGATVEIKRLLKEKISGK